MEELQTQSEPSLDVPIIPHAIAFPLKDALFLFMDEEKQAQLHEAICNIPHIYYYQFKSYYFLTFEILKTLLPNVDISLIIIQFEKRDDTFNKFSTSLLPPDASQTVNIENDQPERKSTKFLTNKKLFSLAGILSFALASLLLFLFCYEENKGNTKIKEEVFVSFARSDLVVPDETALLRRPDLMSQIDDAFKTDHSVQTIALVGMGGAGKTTLARQYARSQRSSVVWEINAETKESLKNSFANLAYALLKTNKEKQDFKELQYIKDPVEREQKILQGVKERLKLHPEWLLIYDNVEKFNDLQKYFPSAPDIWGKGRILLTTRDANIQNSGHVSSVIQVGVLDPYQKLDLFVKIFSSKDSRDSKTPNQKQKKEYDIFLKDIPPLPLDISVAAYYIKATGVSYLQYIKYLNEYDKNFENVSQEVLRNYSYYDRTRTSIITLSLKHLIKVNKDFTDLLLFICLLDSQHIPKELLDRYRGSTLADNFIYHLKKYSLIENKDRESINETYFTIHRNIQGLIFSYLRRTLPLKDNDIINKIERTLEKYIKDAHHKADFQKNLLILISHCTKFLVTTHPPRFCGSKKVNI